MTIKFVNNSSVINKIISIFKINFPFKESKKILLLNSLIYGLHKFLFSSYNNININANKELIIYLEPQSISTSSKPPLSKRSI